MTMLAQSPMIRLWDWMAGTCWDLLFTTTPRKDVTYPPSYPMCTWCSFSRDKVARTVSLPPTSSQ